MTFSPQLQLFLPPTITDNSSLLVAAVSVSTTSGLLCLLGHVSVHCLSASGNAVSVICHSRHWDSRVSVRKEHKRLQQVFVNKQFGFE